MEHTHVIMKEDGSCGKVEWKAGEVFEIEDEDQEDGMIYIKKGNHKTGVWGPNHHEDDYIECNWYNPQEANYAIF